MCRIPASMSSNPSIHFDLSTTDTEKIFFSSLRDHAAEYTPEDRRRITAELLGESCNLQEDTLGLAINAKLPLERWCISLLSRHWQGCLLKGQADIETFAWSTEVAISRTSDIYFRAENAVDAGSATSKRAQHLERIFVRYLIMAYPHQALDFQVRRISYGVGTSASDGGAAVIADRLRRLIEIERSAPENDGLQIADVSRSLFELLSFEYLIRIEDHCEGEQLNGIKRLIKKNIKRTLDLHGDAAFISLPGITKLAYGFLNRSRNLTIDDLVARGLEVVSTVAAGKYNPYRGLSFAPIAKASVISHLRREVGVARSVHMPEALVDAVAKYRAELAKDPLFVHLALPVQLKRCGITLSPVRFQEVLSAEVATDCVSLHATVDNDSGTTCECLIGDGGRQAEEIRAKPDANDPLAEAFAELSPLYQALLSCHVSAPATAGGQSAWLAYVGDRIIKLAQIAAQRATSHPSGHPSLASTVEVFYT